MRCHDREESEGHCGFDVRKTVEGNGLKGCVDNNLQVRKT